MFNTVLARVEKGVLFSFVYTFGKNSNQTVIINCITSSFWKGIKVFIMTSQRQCLKEKNHCSEFNLNLLRSNFKNATWFEIWKSRGFLEQLSS